MPEDYDDVDQDDADESGVIRSLRRELKEAKAAAAEVNDLRQELAITRSGLNLSPKQTKALLAIHEGELDAESLKATAIEIGLIEAPAEEAQVPADEVAGHKRMQEAVSQAEPADAHPMTLEEQIAKAQSADEIMALLTENNMVPDYGEAPHD